MGSQCATKSFFMQGVRLFYALLIACLLNKRSAVMFPLTISGDTMQNLKHFVHVGPDGE